MSENIVNANVQEQYRLYILFSVQGDARFFSHKETHTIWQRAMIRASISVCYSKGFNPHIKMSLPLPRSVGVASECEIMVVYVSDRLEPEEAAARLAGQLPDGLVLLNAGYVPGKDTPLPEEVYYEIEPHSHVDLTVLTGSIERLNAEQEYFVQRQARGRHKARSVNIKENIKEINLENSLIKLVVKISPGATAKLKEVVEAVGLDFIDDVKIIRRTKTVYNGKIFNDLFTLDSKLSS